MTWSDGEPLTANDIAYTYNRILDGGPEAATWSSYLVGVESVEAPDDTTVVLTSKKPNAVLPLLPIPIVPEHVWKNVSEKDVKSFGNEPQDGEPVVGSGPFRFVEGTAGGSTYRFEANPDYWKGAPHVDEVVFRVYKSEDPMVQALIKGEIDFAEDISALQVQSLRGQGGHHRPQRRLARASTRSPSTPARSTSRPASRSGDPNPAVLGRGLPVRPQLRHRPRQIIRTAYQGGGQARAERSSRRPTPTTSGSRRPTTPSPTTRTRPRELLDEAGYTVGDDGFRTLPDGRAHRQAAAGARAATRETSLDVMQFFQEWLADIDIDSEVETYESSKLTNVILEGDFDTFEWGWYVEPDPDSMLSYLTCDQLGGWSDSWYCNEEYDDLYQQQHVEMDDAARAEIVKQMQELLYRDAPYLVTAYSSIGEAFRSDRFACFQPQPDPGGIWLIQYGVAQLPQPAAGRRRRGLRRSGERRGRGRRVDRRRRPARAVVTTTAAGTGAMIGVGVVAGLAVVGGAFVLMRRRATVDDRE